MAVTCSQRCIKHGANVLCTVPGCATNANDRAPPKHKDADSASSTVGVHGCVCVHPGCTAKAQARGLCTKHGGSSKAVCVNPGCTPKASARGLCTKHGGCTKGVCMHPGCTTKAHARRLCKKHGGNHFQTMPRTRFSYLSNRARALLQAQCTWGVPRTRLPLQSACQRMVHQARRPVQPQINVPQYAGVATQERVAMGA
jgi:hypothetical protein